MRSLPDIRGFIHCVNLPLKFFPPAIYQIDHFTGRRPEERVLTLSHLYAEDVIKFVKVYSKLARNCAISFFAYSEFASVSIPIDSENSDIMP